MLPELCRAVDRTIEQTPLSNQFVLVLDSIASDGSFVLHHYVSWSLKTNCCVIFVAFAQVFGHYLGALKKMNVNVEAMVSAGQLQFIDAMTTLVTPRGDQSDANAFSLTSGHTLKDLFLLIRAKVDSSTRPAAIVFDDLSTLLSIGVSVVDIAQFVLQCCGLVRTASASDSRGFLLALLHAEHADADQDAFDLGNRLSFSADQLITVRGLESGKSLDIHGQITVRSSMDYDAASAWKSQFRILDHAVTFVTL